jgi:hypothetical protein
MGVDLEEQLLAYCSASFVIFFCNVGYISPTISCTGLPAQKNLKVGVAITPYLLTE